MTPAESAEWWDAVQARLRDNLPIEPLPLTDADCLATYLAEWRQGRERRQEATP